ncbi:MAG: flavodoxin family protein [Desulfobacteraceae bacterium]|nr:MAG: flavodoxin family protein [Desulfobacteraceae bacterium]
MVPIKLLGVSATPIKDGNCDSLVKKALEFAEELGDVNTEFMSTAGKEIKVCIHCQWCIENRAPCRFKDDVHEILDGIERCDGLIIGSPAWINTLSPFVLNIFSRARYQVFFTNKFRNKVAGLLTLGFFGIGLEHALDVLRNVVSCFNIIPVAEASVLASTAAYGERPAYLEHGVLDDKRGMRQTKAVATRVVELTRMLKYARQAGVGLPERLQLTAIGAQVKQADQKVFVDGVWRDKED